MCLNLKTSSELTWYRVTAFILSTGQIQTSQSSEWAFYSPLDLWQSCHAVARCSLWSDRAFWRHVSCCTTSSAGQEMIKYEDCQLLTLTHKPEIVSRRRLFFPDDNGHLIMTADGKEHILKHCVWVMSVGIDNRLNCYSRSGIIPHQQNQLSCNCETTRRLWRQSGPFALFPSIWLKEKGWHTL